MHFELLILRSEEVRVHTFPKTTAKLWRESAISCHKLRKKFRVVLFYEDVQSLVGKFCVVENEYIAQELVYLSLA